MNKINQALHDELLAMRERDQEVRKTLVEKYGMNPNWSADDLAWMESVDYANTTRMKEIIAQYGWPGYSLVGAEGEHTAWLLVQHAGRDLPFQNQCLALLTAAVEAGDASARNMAYLVDRVRVNEGKPQLYGTQYRIHDGDFSAGEIEDSAGVEIRRAQVGLGSFEEQLAELRQLYKPQEA